MDRLNGMRSLMLGLTLALGFPAQASDDTSDDSSDGDVDLLGKPPPKKSKQSHQVNGKKVLKVSGFAASAGLAVTGGVFLASSLSERNAVRDDLQSGALSLEDAVAPTTAANRKVGLGYGCVALGVGVALTTNSLLSVGAGGPGVSLALRGAW